MSSMSRVVGVKFKDYGQIYYFEAGGHELSVKDWIIVETDQGRGMAQVATLDDAPGDADAEQELKPILGVAGADDFAVKAENDALAAKAHRFCRERIFERGLDMKLVEVEVFHDKSKVIFYFTAPGRVDFRELVKDLVREFRTRIELRQIGVRHETQMIGAVGNCGQLCCCRRFLRKFDPVTIKMAKEQNLFLNPSKISGMCGRLLCCLGYEQHNYEDFQRRCPKLGRRFRTSQGVFKVLRSNFFRETVTVLSEEGEERDFTLDEWTEIVQSRVDAPSDQSPHASPRPPRQAPRPQASEAVERAPEAAAPLEAPSGGGADEAGQGLVQAVSSEATSEAASEGTQEKPGPQRPRQSPAAKTGQGERKSQGRGRRPRRRGGRKGGGSGS